MISDYPRHLNAVINCCEALQAMFVDLPTSCARYCETLVRVMRSIARCLQTAHSSRKSMFVPCVLPEHPAIVGSEMSDGTSKSLQNYPC